MSLASPHAAGFTGKPGLAPWAQVGLLFTLCAWVASGFAHVAHTHYPRP